MKVIEKKVFIGSRVLDVGCGNGRLYQMLKNKKIDYLGLDFSEKLITEAKMRFPKAKFKVGDLTKETTWRKLNNKFDFVFCVAVFHHLPTKKIRNRLVESIWQSLKPEGQIFITVWNLWQKKYFKHNFTARSLKLKWRLKDLRAFYLPYIFFLKGGKKRTVYRFLYLFSKNELEKFFLSKFLIEKCWNSGFNFCLVGKKKI